MKFRGVICCLGAYLCCVSASPRAGLPAERAFVRWAREHAIPLKTVAAGNGFDDMQGLRQIVGGARIVALGEATHGTSEFFQLKHRMIEFLATRMGFTIFAIEAGMPECHRLNDFVLNGKGDPKQLLHDLSVWPWDTEEVLDMILWMRKFNESGKGRIEFTGFDMQIPTLAMASVRKFVETNDRAWLPRLDAIYKAVQIAYESERPRRPISYQTATGTFPLQVVAGAHIQYSGYIRTKGIADGYAGLWWRVDGAKGSKPLFFDNMAKRGAKGTTPWTYYEISVDVPENARNINFGILHTGAGTAWFDSLRVDVNGKPWNDTNRFDFDFESGKLRGLRPWGELYKATPDASVAHTGRQSLRSQFVGAQPDKEGPIPGVLFDECMEAVSHLRTERSYLIHSGTSEQEVDWIIQNAELVLQSVEMQGGERSRDRSMADNVKWIADHNPNARLVLWAHNGHIGYGKGTMGNFLKRAFGKQLVNFGFAFGSGGFNAFDPDSRTLKAFVVGPLPRDSLDWTLTDVGFPIFGLDLRDAPKAGPVGRWLDQPHPTRRIGAIYRASSSAIDDTVEEPARQWFDAILFVEKTTPSRVIQ